MGSSDKEEQILVLSALLHDIGKMVQRASSNFKEKKHEEFGADFLNHHLKIRDQKVKSEVIEIVRSHHRIKYRGNYPNLLNIVKIADGISASHDRDESEGVDEKINVTPLLSVFTYVDIGAYEGQHRMYYPAHKLSVRNLAYPLEEMKARNNRKLYNDIKEHMIDDLGFLDIKTKEDINTLVYVLHKHLRYIPSAVYISVPDIPLYDHLKTTAAIALCLYRSKNVNKKFVFVMGDLSGIQNFIFKTLKGGETQSVDEKGTKRMRGRSTMIKLIIDSAVRYIVETLDLYEFNILWQRGGNFLILAPNDENLDEKINEIRKHINEFLLNQFGDLYLNIVWEAYDNINNFSSILEDIHRKLNYVGKSRKFIDFVRDEKFYFDNSNAGRFICPVCGIHPVNDPNEICETCRKLEKIGDAITKSKYLVRMIGTHENSTFAFNYGDITISYSFETSGDNLRGEVFSLDSFNLPPSGDMKGFKIFKAFVPHKNGKTLSISDLIEVNSVKSKYGVFKADVDCLGEIFSRGLKKEIKDRVSISRVSMLSFLMDLFFTVEVNNIAKKHDIYVVFSGGDDLTAVGRYDNIVDFAMEVQEKFERWVGNNENLHISAGILFFNEKFPLRRAVELTEEALDEAKKPDEKVNKCVKRGNKITIFGHTIGWNLFKNQIDLAKNLQSAYEDGIISSSFSHYLLTLYRLSPAYYSNHPLEKGAYIIPNPLPYLRYYFGKRKINLEAEDLLNNIANEDTFDHIPVAVSFWVLDRKYKKVR